MSNQSFAVVRPGALTTVQDLGRPGHQREGVSVGGAMDHFAAAVANILVGNPPGVALLEITLLGPKLRFLEPTTVAITGADLTAEIGGRAIHPWSSTTVAVGDEISFVGRRTGARTYLAVRRGLDLPLVLGSRSTDLRAKMGGYLGRALQAGDILYSVVPNARDEHHVGGRSLQQSDIAELRPTDLPMRVLPAGIHDRVNLDRIKAFLNREYLVRPDSDRMGFRLDGPGIEWSESTSDRWSEPVTAGTIQLPPGGKPIVLMADRQTVGGYPKLGTVISVDIGRLAQIAPGQPVRFAQTTLEEAQALLDEQESFLRTIHLANE